MPIAFVSPSGTILYYTFPWIQRRLTQNCILYISFSHNRNQITFQHDINQTSDENSRVKRTVLFGELPWINAAFDWNTAQISHVLNFKPAAVYIHTYIHTYIHRGHRSDNTCNHSTTVHSLGYKPRQEAEGKIWFSRGISLHVCTWVNG